MTNAPFLTISPLVQPRHFYKKIFHLHLHWQIWGSQSPLRRGGMISFELWFHLRSKSNDWFLYEMQHWTEIVPPISTNVPFYFDNLRYFPANVPE